MLWNKCKKLTYFTSNVSIQYRIRESDNVHTVTHIADFKNDFPDIDITSKSFIIIVNSLNFAF